LIKCCWENKTKNKNKKMARGVEMATVILLLAGLCSSTGTQSLKCLGPDDIRDLGGFVYCSNGSIKNLFYTQGNFSNGSPNTHMGMWCDVHDQLAAALPCNPSGTWSILFEATFATAFEAGLNVNVAWATVDKTKEDIVAMAGVPCRLSRACLSSPITAIYDYYSSSPENRTVAAEVHCAAGTYVVLHEDLTVRKQL
jgi:hypothetical protein